VKLPNLSLSDVFRSLQPRQPAFALAGSDATPGSTTSSGDNRGGTMMFASGSDDDGYGGYDDEQYEDTPQNTRRAPGAQRGGSGGSGSGGSGGGGRQRSVQFQPEERYWTEYLRIALPIIGLLLMIGLFWYWASQLTDDDNGGNEPISTQPAGTTEIITPESTPAPTEQPVVQPTDPPAETPTSVPDETESTPPDEETDAADDGETEDGTEGDGSFAVDDSVVITEDGVNMRDDATTAGNIVTTLDAGEVLTIQDGPFEADGYVWWEVIVESTGEIGYVVDDFFEVAP
jgi:hypothetical protein